MSIPIVLLAGSRRCLVTDQLIPDTVADLSRPSIFAPSVSVVATEVMLIGLTRVIIERPCKEAIEEKAYARVLY